MRLMKYIYKAILFSLGIVCLYALLACIGSFITVNNLSGENRNHSIYLNTNGVHLDLILPIDLIDESVLDGMKYNEQDAFLSFGWGDENFYINTPTWDDLTISNAVGALFLKSSTLMHVSRYRRYNSNWVEVKVNDKELQTINGFINASFKKDELGRKLHLENAGYTKTDDFYKALGSYSCFRTCNSWTNEAFKESGLKACFWTPFDFGLLWKYE